MSRVLVIGCGGVASVAIRNAVRQMRYLQNFVIVKQDKRKM